MKTDAKLLNIMLANEFNNTSKRNITMNSKQTKPAGEGGFGSSPLRTLNEQTLEQWLTCRMLHQRIGEGQFPAHILKMKPVPVAGL
jgi:hypothetical protein